MTLRQIEHLLAVYRHKSFSAAARHLQISQPTLSRSISHLEAQLGIELFYRSKAGAEPTSFVRRVAETAESVLQQAGLLSRELERLARRETDQIRIGADPAAGKCILPSLVSVASQTLKGVQLRTRQGFASELIKALNQDVIDVLFVHSEYALDAHDFIRVQVLSDETVAVFHPDHDGLIKTPIQPLKLIELPLAMTAMPPSLSNILAKQAARNGCSAERFISDDFELIRRRVIESEFVSIAPSFVFDEAVRAGQMVRVRLDWAPRYVCWMLAKPETWQVPAVKTLASIAKQTGQALMRRAGLG